MWFEASLGKIIESPLISVNELDMVVVPIVTATGRHMLEDHGPRQPWAKHKTLPEK
jgi:hypothetical protein